MRDYKDFFNELILEDSELEKELKLTELKYIIIEKLVSYRKSKKISQSEFADSIGVKQQMISRFEKGEVDPRLSFISKIINGMNLGLTFTDQNYVKSDEKPTFVTKKNIIKFPTEYKFIDNEIA